MTPSPYEKKFQANDTIGPGIATVYVTKGGGYSSPVGFHFDSEDGKVKGIGFNLSLSEARRLAAFLVENT